METDRLLPVIGAGLVLGLGIAARLIGWRRRLPADLVGRVKADAAQAMLRALLVLLVGLALLLGATVAGRSAFVEAAQWVSWGLIAIGGVAFVARLALYALRIKPQLDHLQAPVGSAVPAVDLGETELGEAEGARSPEAGLRPPPDGDRPPS